MSNSRRKTEPNDIVQCRSDCDGPNSLSDQELRKKYPLSFQTYDGLRNRNTKSRGPNRAIVHDAWKGRSNFRNFLSELGPKGHVDITLDRIDNDRREYGPGLCRWATKKEQTRNRSNTVKLTSAGGVTQSLAEWSEIMGIPESTMRQRKSDGWPDDCVIRNVPPKLAATQIKPKYWPDDAEKAYTAMLAKLPVDVPAPSRAEWASQVLSAKLRHGKTRQQLWDQIESPSDVDGIQRYRQRAFKEFERAYFMECARRSDFGAGLGPPPSVMSDEEVQHKLEAREDELEKRREHFG